MTDADRRSASALHDLHSIRVVRQQGTRPPDLFGGGTYRIHGLLLTVPRDYRMEIGRYLSADCPVRDNTCADRFSLSLYNTDGFGYFEGSITLYRWSGAEHSRTLDGSTGRSPVTILADDPDAEVPSSQRWVSDLFDEFLATLGQPPAPRPDARAGGPASGRMRLALQAPAICEAQSSRGNAVDVVWTVTGGRAPYEVTIAGERYLGKRGIASVNCSLPAPDFGDSGRRRIQGTAVDALGDTAAARADMYVIQTRYAWEYSLSPGETYRASSRLLTIPTGVEAQMRRAGTSHCEREPTEYWDGCEAGIVFELSAGGHSASVELSEFSATEHARTVADDTPQSLRDKLDELLASIDAAPQLPSDFRDTSTRMSISAFTNPPDCVVGESVQLFWAVTGGRWWPILAQLDGQRLSQDSPAYVQCNDEVGHQDVRLQATERGPSPRTVLQGHRINVIARSPSYQDEIYVEWLTHDSQSCVAGELFDIDWSTSLRDGDADLRVTFELGSDTRTFAAAGETQLRCPPIAGPHLFTMRATANTTPPTAEVRYAVMHVINARPARWSP